MPDLEYVDTVVYTDFIGPFYYQQLTLDSAWIKWPLKCGMELVSHSKFQWLHR